MSTWADRERIHELQREMARALWPPLDDLLGAIECLNWTWGMGNGWGGEERSAPTASYPATKRYAVVHIWPHPDHGDWGPFHGPSDDWLTGEFEDAESTDYPDGATLRDALAKAFTQALERANGYWQDWEDLKDDDDPDDDPDAQTE